MAEAQGLDNQVGKEPVEKSLAPFSNADIIRELERRFHADPKLDPTVLEKFDEVTAEIKKKLTPEEPKTDLKPATEPVDNSEAQPQSESEGKKWAEILRKEGWGILRGKFRKSWTFINPSGNEEQVSNEEGPFTGGGRFGIKNSPYMGKSSRVIERDFLPDVDRYNFSFYQKKGEIFNSLIIMDGSEASEKDFGKGFAGWKIIFYSSYLANAPDARGGVIKLEFALSVPPNRASDFVSRVKKNPDFIEEVFQNIYPGLTGEGKAKRVIVEKMKLIDRSSLGKENTATYLSFSSPVGETPYL